MGILNNFKNPWAANSNSQYPNVLNNPFNTLDEDNVLNQQALQTNVFEGNEEVLGVGTATKIKLEVSEGTKIISENGDVYITEYPKMPVINVKVSSETLKKVSCKLVIKYEHSYTHQGKEIVRKIEKLFPEIGKVYSISTNTIHNGVFDFGDVIIGGDAVLRIFETEDGKNLLQEFKFMIKGTNPTEKSVNEYIDAQGYDWWFFKGIVKQESDGGHFSKKTETLNYQGTKFTNTKGMPFFGPPDGFGLMQIDRYEEKNIEDLSYIWNWKQNIDKCAEEIKQKITATKTDMNRSIAKFKKSWDKDKTSVIGADDKIEGTITFTHAPTLLEGFGEINQYFDSSKVTSSTVKSFIDANVIRRYNGGQYYYVEFDKSDDKWKWQIDDSSSQSGNYVKNVCNKLSLLMLFIMNTFFLSNNGEAQVMLVDSVKVKNREPAIKIKEFAPEKVYALLPKNYKILDSSWGYLNDDVKKDYAFILQDTINNENSYIKQIITVVLSKKENYFIYCNNVSVNQYQLKTDDLVIAHLWIRSYSKKISILLHTSMDCHSIDEYVFMFNKSTNKIEFLLRKQYDDRFKYHYKTLVNKKGAGTNFCEFEFLN